MTTVMNIASATADDLEVTIHAEGEHIFHGNDGDVYRLEGNRALIVYHGGGYRVFPPMSPEYVEGGEWDMLARKNNIGDDLVHDVGQLVGSMEAPRVLQHFVVGKVSRSYAAALEPARVVADA